MIAELKNLLIKTLAGQAYAALVAIPGFGWVFGLPVVRPVVQFIINQVVGWSVQETSVGLSLLWIQMEMSYEIKDAEDAKNKLADMLQNTTKYSVVQQQQISEYFDETTVTLIQLGIKRLG